MTEAPAAVPPAPAPGPSATPLLEVRGLNAYYGRAHVLQDVSFELAAGSIAIIGRNGMGKTTLCNAIMGITPPTATGSIRFAGEELVGGHSYRIARRGIGYVPQGRRLFPSLSVDEHLKIASRGAAEADGEAWTRGRVYELFPRLAERKRNGGAQLSGGEQQMLAIGRALVTNPRLLVMDEPSEGLAPQLVAEVMATIRRLKEQGLSIVLVEQNPKLVFQVADDVVILNGGRVVAEGLAADFQHRDVDLRQHLGIF